MTKPGENSGDNVAIAMTSMRSAIANGLYQPGRRIKEVEIAEALGMSRTPVREAIRRLVGEGLLQLTPNRGAEVPTWSDRDLEEMFEVRAQLEAFAARLVAQRASGAQISELRMLCGRMERLSDEIPHSDLWNEFAIVNNEFHRKLLTIAGNSRLESSALGLIAPALLHNQIANRSIELLNRSNQHHAEIVDAVAARDEAWAESIMRTHVIATRNALVTARSDDAVAS